MHYIRDWIGVAYVRLKDITPNWMCTCECVCVCGCVCPVASVWSLYMNMSVCVLVCGNYLYRKLVIGYLYDESTTNVNNNDDNDEDNDGAPLPPVAWLIAVQHRGRLRRGARNRSRLISAGRLLQWKFTKCLVSTSFPYEIVVQCQVRIPSTPARTPHRKCDTTTTRPTCYPYPRRQC